MPLTLRAIFFMVLLMLPMQTMRITNQPLDIFSWQQEITWKSKKQTTIALSSTEAEYVALSEAGREVCWGKNLFLELRYSQNSPILIKGNNNGLIMMAHNSQLNNQTKIHWHWVHELDKQDVLTIQSCWDLEQTADVLTKALPHPKHKRHTLEIGLTSA
jgi:hypothetical protein